LLSAALMILLQVGPNPNTGAVPGLPPEILDWREMERQKESASVTVASRIDNCLARAEEDPSAALLEAEDWFSRASDIERAQALHCKGYSEAQLTRWRDAATSFSAAREAVGDRDTQYRARLGAIAGSSLITAGDNSGALALLDLAAADAAIADFVALGGEVQIDRARALLAMENSDGAAAALANARKLSPASSRAWLLSATLARRSDDLESAATFITQANKIDPTSSEILLEAGLIAVFAGEDAVARDKWEQIVAMIPESPQHSTAQAYLRQLEQE